MSIGKYFDHTILKPEAKKEDVIRLCKEARENHFASVCVNPYYAGLVSRELEGSDVMTCSVVGFPLGATFKEAKALETRMAIENGAKEIDTVINIGALRDHDDDVVYEDILAVVEAARGKAAVKVIIETCLLTEEEKERACRLSLKAGADFVKTSTGFSTGGATTEDVALMRRVVGNQAQVKASGGIRDYQKAQAMLAAGADRLGVSSSMEILAQENA